MRGRSDTSRRASMPARMSRATWLRGRARDAFAVPVRAGTPEHGISGLVDSVQAPRYAVPVGLVLYAARRLAQGGVPSGSMVKSAGVERWFGPLKRWLQDFF